MEKKLFKKGDWCFCEFKLQQIVKTEEGRITGVSDGNFTLSSYDLSDRCYPIEMKVKQISDTVKYWSEEFHKLNGNLNYPDLNRELIRRWVELCDNRNNEEALKNLFGKMEKFGISVKRKVHDIKNETVEGVELFR